jgi:glutamate 5-kinase
VTNLVEADLLIILTDQAGLYSADPRTDATAHLITEGNANDVSLENIAGGSSTLGRGGMLTKVQASARAARSGASTVIASGQEPSVLTRIAGGEAIGTFLKPARERLAARKQWLAGRLQTRGRLKLDPGAIRVLRQSGSSLLPVGVTAVEGDFARGELVVCCSKDGGEVARGLVNYSASEARQIIGQPSERIEAILGYVDEPELIHRDNLVVM